MEALIQRLDILLLALYVSLFLLYSKNLFLNRNSYGLFFRTALPITIAIHLFKLILQGIHTNRCPVVDFHETFSFLAFSLALIYLIVERYQRYFASGALFLFFVFLLQSVILFKTGERVINPELENIPYAFHAPLALLAITAFFTAAIYSIIYLVLLSLLKRKHFGTPLKGMPPLETIEKMQTLSAAVGAIVMAVALVIGTLLTFLYEGRFNPLDAKIILSLIILLVFAYGVIGSRFFSFSGKKKSVITIVGLVLTLLSMTLARLYLPTFHKF